MRLLVYLGHPAHFHLFRHTIHRMKKSGHLVTILARRKDVLEDLLQAEDFPYVNVHPNDRSESMAGMIRAMLIRQGAIFRNAISPRQTLMVGTCAEIGHIGMLLRIPSIVVNEDDHDVVPRFANLAYPFCTHILAPACCGVGGWVKKTISYKSYHELAYLHPDHFQPDRKVVSQFHRSDSPYYLLRFAKLTAHHDVGRHGINREVARRLVDYLGKKGRVYITSERELEPEFEPYRIQLPPSLIHHALAFADLYVGDSQTMAAESAVLGTPSLRFNDFVGEIGYLEELEHKFALTFGVRSDDPDRLFDLVEEFTRPGVLQKWQERRQVMLKERINFSAFMSWLFENYPSSARALRHDPDRQLQFLKAGNQNASGWNAAHG